MRQFGTQVNKRSRYAKRRRRRSKVIYACLIMRPVIVQPRVKEKPVFLGMGIFGPWHVTRVLWLPLALVRFQAVTRSRTSRRFMEITES